MRKTIAALAVTVATLAGVGALAGTAAASPAAVRVSERQVGAECWAELQQAGYNAHERFGREARDVPAVRLLTMCGIATVRAEDGSRVPVTFYSQG